MKQPLLLVLLLTALSFGSLPISAAAQVSPPLRPVPPVPNAVTVLGEAVAYAPPDRAQLRFGVETTGATPGETFRRHEQEVQAVLTAVRRLGIPDRWIQLEWVGLNERRDDRGQRDGYVATRVVTVTTDDLARVPELVSTVIEAGATNLNGLQYTLEDDAGVEQEALRAAFERAEAKARELARAAGARLGPAIAVSEQGVQPPLPLYGRAALESVALDVTPGAYSTGQNEVRAFVVVTFALEAR